MFRALNHLLVRIMLAKTNKWWYVNLRESKGFVMLCCYDMEVFNFNVLCNY